MENEIITTEVRQELHKESTGIITEAMAIAIKSEKDTERATTFLVMLKKMRTKIEEKISPAVKKAREAYDEIRGLRDKMIGPIKSTESELRQKLDEFVTAENARREALQRKADKKFQKAAEKAEATGKPLTQAPQIMQKVKTISSASFSVSWYAEVTDKMALLKAIVEGKSDITAVEVNMPFLNALAKAYRQEKEFLPGVMAKKKTITRV